MQKCGSTMTVVCESQGNSFSYEADDGGVEGFFWFLVCCVYPCVGVPVLICWWCDSCCFKGKGR